MIDVLVLGDANRDLVLGGDVVPRFGQAEQLLDSADFVVVAGYLDGRLRGLSDEHCLRRGVLAAAMSTTASGGTAGQPTADRLAEGDLP